MYARWLIWVAVDRGIWACQRSFDREGIVTLAAVYSIGFIVPRFRFQCHTYLCKKQWRYWILCRTERRQVEIVLLYNKQDFRKNAFWYLHSLATFLRDFCPYGCTAITQSLQICLLQIHEGNFLFHHKGSLMAWDLQSGSRNQFKMIWALWHGTIRRWLDCSYKWMVMVSNNTGQENIPHIITPLDKVDLCFHAKF